MNIMWAGVFLALGWLWFYLFIRQFLFNLMTAYPLLKQMNALDKELIAQCAEKTGLIVTAEEHSVIGGLGSAVAETVTEMCPVPVVKIGVNDEYGHSGPAVDLLKEFGLSAENIVKTVKESMNLKK